MSAVEKITAALDEAERIATAATPGPWVALGAQPLQGIVAPMNGEMVGVTDGWERRTDRALVVSVVNRERAQIQHARELLAEHEQTHAEWATGAVEVCACSLIPSLLAVWCPS